MTEQFNDRSEETEATRKPRGIKKLLAWMNSSDCTDQQEWDLDTPLVVKAGPWRGPSNTEAFGRFSPIGTALIYRLLGEAQDERLAIENGVAGIRSHHAEPETPVKP